MSNQTNEPFKFRTSFDLDPNKLYEPTLKGSSTIYHEKNQLTLVRCFLFLGSFLPFVYIWSLPLLQKTGYANEGDVGSDTDVGIYTVSGYISTTEATGGMAATFFWPILFMWHGPKHKITNRFTGLSFLTIFVFQISFGVFLSNPTTYNNTVHVISVGVFCLAAIVHLTYVAHKGVNDGRANVALVTGILGFSGVVIMNFVIIKGMLFWAVECIGLTGLIWYTPIVVYFGKQSEE